MDEGFVRLEVLAPHRDGIRPDRPYLPPAVRDLYVQHGHDPEVFVLVVRVVEPRLPLTPPRVGDRLFVRLADGPGHHQEPPGEVPVSLERQRDLVLVVFLPRRRLRDRDRHRVVLAELRHVPRGQVVPVRPLPVELRASRGGYQIAVVVIRRRGCDAHGRHERGQETRVETSHPGQHAIHPETDTGAASSADGRPGNTFF